MKKKILAIILCVLMVVPCFIWNITAVDTEGPNGEERINIAPNGKTYQTSNWNQDSSARYLNNGILWHSWQFWRPGSSYRPDTPNIDDSLQYVGMKFNNYYSVNEITIYGMKYADTNGAYCGKCDKYINDSDFTPTYKEVSGQQVVDRRLCNACGTNVIDLQMTVRNGRDVENNIKYTVKVLVQGQWIEAGHGYNNDMEYCVDKDYQVIGGDMGALTIKLDKVLPQYDAQGNIVVDSDGNPIYSNYATTKNIKIECTEYGGAPYNKDPDATQHEWWLVPILYEVQCWGFKTVNTPKFDVPEGAEVVSDAALGGMASATTSAQGQYPLLGNDRNSSTFWRANDYEDQSYWIDFDKEYQIKDVKLNFGGMHSVLDGTEMAYDVYVKKNGEWTKLTSDTVTAESELWREDDLKVYEIGNENISGVKITFTSSVKDGAPASPAITEVGASISNGEQCVFLSGYLDYFRASSTAQGNLACYGEAYCSSSFDYSNISDVTYINDGQVTDDSFSWYANDFVKGTYCGIKLKETETVSKVVLYFNDIITQGKPEEHILSYDIQAKVNGEFVTIASATSYDESTKKPVVSVNIENPVATDDIRIVYQSNGLVFPYLKEIEIFAGEKVYGAYQGYQLDLSMRTLHGMYPTSAFAQKTVIGRAKFMDLVSPIEHLILAAQYGIDPADIK